MPAARQCVIILSKSLEDSASVIGKRSCSKVQLLKLGLATPSAFVVTTQAFQRFLMYQNGQLHFKTMLDNCRPTSLEDIESTARGMQKFVLNHEFEPELAGLISDTYNQVLKSQWAHLTISPTTSTIAPVNYPLPTIKGESVLLDFLRQIWAAQLTPHALSLYLISKTTAAVSPAPVMVSQFEPAATSGTITTIDPLTKDKNLVLIKAIWGTNPQVDPREIESDEYVVSKTTGLVVSRKPQIQESLTTIDRFGHYKYVPIAPKQQMLPKIDVAQIGQMLKAAIKIQNYCLKPQVINWLSVNETVYFTRFTDEEILEFHPRSHNKKQKSEEKIIASGLSISPGIATAPLWRPSSTTTTLVGRIALLRQATHSGIKLSRTATGIVIESADVSTEIVLFAREIGIPVLAGTGPIKLANNQVVTIDAIAGQLRQNCSLSIPGQPTPVTTSNHVVVGTEHTNTATKVYVNIGIQDKKQATMYRDADGVGLLRASDILLKLGSHPKYLIKKHLKETEASLLTAIKDISLHFGDRPIYYYPYNEDTQTASKYTHGNIFETTIEQNPLLGYRGANRIITDDLIFTTELKCLVEARNKAHCKNISLIIPFVRSLEEFTKVKRIVSSAGLHRSPSFSLFAELSTPASPLILPKMIEDGLDGVYVNLDYLAALTLGYDPKSAEVSQNIDIKHPAVLALLSQMIAVASVRNIPVTVSSHQLDQQEEAIESVIRAGVTGVTISNQRISPIKVWIHASELKCARTPHAHT